MTSDLSYERQAAREQLERQVAHGLRRNEELLQTISQQLDTLILGLPGIPGVLRQEAEMRYQEWFGKMVAEATTPSEPWAARDASVVHGRSAASVASAGPTFCGVSMSGLPDGHMWAMLHQRDDWTCAACCAATRSYG